MKKQLLLYLLIFSQIAYAQFPEGFETDVPPSGWTSFIGENGEGTVQNWKTSTLAASGSQAAYVQYENVANQAEDWLVTPQFTPTSQLNILTFQQRQSYSSDYSTTYTIRVSTASQTTHADFTIVDTQSESDFGTTYASHTVDLSAYNDTPIYVAFVMANDDGDNWYIDDVDLVADAMAPNCVDNLSPADGATDVTVDADGPKVTLSWDASVVDNNHDAATSYEVMWGTESGSLSSLGSIAGTSVEIVNVSYGATYYWMIIPSNVGGSATGCSEYSFTTSAYPTIPYMNQFTTFPSGFTEASGAYGSPSGTTGSFTADDFVNDTSHPNGKSAKINIYGTSIDEYLISPEFNLSGSDYFLNFDVGLTQWNNSNNATLGVDDYVALLVTQDGGTTWTELDRWDSTTPISNTGSSATEKVLSGYGDTVQFAFYAFSDTSNEDTDFFIDNFQITASTLGTENNTLEGFTLYPTIVKEELNFNSQKNIEAIAVYNLIGQEVYKGMPNANSSSINLSSLRPGVYIVKVTAEGLTGSYKIIKE